jgi:hypothetical protein
MHAFAVVGYTFNAENLCAGCTIQAMIDGGLAAPAARDMLAEDVLDMVAEANVIDRHDESTFDSSEFPKVIFCHMTAENEVCCSCFERF